MTAANENRTHLYRIRRKSDGLFLTTLTYGHPLANDAGTWGKTGCFWLTQETIKEHLLELCQFRVYLYDDTAKVYDLRKRRRRGHNQRERDMINPFWVIAPCGTPIRLVKTVYDRLNNYEIVATEISVHGSQVMEAVDFASFKEDLEQKEML